MTMARFTPSGLFGALILAALPCEAIAQTSAADICYKGKVSRERVAITVLANAGVSPYPLAWAADHPEPYPTLTPAWRVLTDTNYCKPVSGSVVAREDGTPQCKKDDLAKIDKARVAVLQLFDEDSIYGNPDNVTRIAYFTTPGAVLTCPIETPVENPWIKGPDVARSIPLRLRGSTDGLQFDRIIDAEQFAGLDRASISWADDRTKDTSTFKLTAILGLAVPISEENHAQIIPYIGYKISRSKKAPAPRETADDILRAGFVYSFHLRGDNWTNTFTARSEYTANRVEGSEVISENLGWVPEWKYLNEYGFKIRDANYDVLFSIMPRADFRMNLGRFISQGTRPDVDSHNFWRVGFQYGGTIKSDLTWLPVDLTVLNTRLYTLRGNSDSLGQLKATLTANFGKDKLFGVDLNYTRGRIEDLVKREDSWTIGFGAKF